MSKKISIWDTTLEKNGIQVFYCIFGIHITNWEHTEEGDYTRFWDGCTKKGNCLNCVIDKMYS